MLFSVFWCFQDVSVNLKSVINFLLQNVYVQFSTQWKPDLSKPAVSWASHMCHVQTPAQQLHPPGQHSHGSVQSMDEEHSYPSYSGTTWGPPRPLTLNGKGSQCRERVVSCRVLAQSTKSPQNSKRQESMNTDTDISPVNPARKITLIHVWG